MSTFQLLIVCVTVLLLAALVVACVLARSAPVEIPGVFAGLSAGQEVVVYLDGGQIVRGTVVRSDGSLTVGGAVFIADGTETKVGLCRLSTALMVQEL